MKKYKVTIEVTISDSESIDANNIEDAKKKAIDMYNNSDFVLEPGYETSRMIMVHDSNKDTDGEWEEF